MFFKNSKGDTPLKPRQKENPSFCTSSPTIGECGAVLAKVAILR
jgi:hypothetical protein